MYYCLNAEFYDSGKVLACVTSRNSDKKPRDQIRQVHGMTAFRIWLTNKFIAESLLSSINNGATNINDVLQIFLDNKVAA